MYHELLLTVLWYGVVHTSALVRCTAARMFEVLNTQSRHTEMIHLNKFYKSCFVTNATEKVTLIQSLTIYSVSR